MNMRRSFFGLGTLLAGGAIWGCSAAAGGSGDDTGSLQAGDVLAPTPDAGGGAGGRGGGADGGMPLCGDGICDPREDCTSCAQDCGACGTCGDGVCDPKREESCSTCTKDCGPCGTCGDGTCAGGERCDTCAADCPYADEKCDFQGCNGHDGSNEADCLAEGNPGGCTQEVLIAWCNRRVDADPTRWDTIHHDWVAARCSGVISLDVNTFSCKDDGKCKTFECTTPLVLLFDPAVSVGYSDDDGRGLFDLSSAHDGSAVSTDWPTAATPWLALDRDGDGRISAGAELFGSATPVGAGTAANGFEALASLDENGDGVLDARDRDFARLVIWTDRDGDRVSSAGELRPLAELGAVSLELGYVNQPRCDARGNCERERAAFRWTDGSGRARTGALVDVHLAVHR